MNKKLLQREQVLLEMLYEKNEIIKQLTAQIEELKKQLATSTSAKDLAPECKNKEIKEVEDGSNMAN